MPREPMDDEFQAEMDMQTIQMAKSIVNNPQRLNAAKAAAGKKAEMLMKFANEGVDITERTVLGQGFRKV